MILKKQIRQLEYEMGTWKRQLTFMTDENIHMKIRLVEILREELSDPSSLEGAESFQTLFIEQDSVIDVLRSQVAEFGRLLKHELFEEGNLSQSVLTEHKRLEAGINTAKNNFDNLKHRFNRYIMEEF